MRPILVHGLGYYENTGMNDLERIDFNSANSIIRECNSPHYGLHLAIRSKDMLTGMTEDDIYKRMSNQIQFFKKSLSVPLLLENSPDTPHDREAFDLYPYVMPEQIYKLVVENDVSFLLDITHAKITAKYRGWDVFDYIGRLPLDHVVEIHTNGSGHDENGFPMDTHQAMEEEDYELLEWVLNRTNPKIVTLEFNEVETEDYDKVIDSLEKQLTRIYDICSTR
ncbi:MAG: DUF692 family multinuclear iron-containing protein [Clostridium beijerinckii]